MHYVTSVLFLPSIAAHLPPASAAFMIRTYFALLIIVYISRGRPPLAIADLYVNSTVTPSPPGPHPTPSTNILKRWVDVPQSAENWIAAGGNKVITPNPWLPLIQTVVAHPDEHYCKTQRALLHYATLLGTTRRGKFAHLAKDLEGAEILDGTLFVRAAGLTANKLGWVREGEAQNAWDQGGFIFE